MKFLWIRSRIKPRIKTIIRFMIFLRTITGILITRKIERIGFIALMRSTSTLHFVFKITKRSTFKYQKAFTHILRLDSGSVKEAPSCEPYRQLYFLHLAVLAADKQSKDKKKKARNMFNNLYSVQIQKVANKNKKLSKKELANKAKANSPSKNKSDDNKENSNSAKNNSESEFFSPISIFYLDKVQNLKKTRLLWKIKWQRLL